MVKSTVLKTRWLPLVLILGVYLPLVLWYSVTVPIFEGPDESSHYKVAYGLLSTGHLPVLNYAVSGEEEHQPPLYYTLVASVLRLVDAGAADGFMLRNPHAAISAVDSLGNKNAFLHGDPAERWPFRDVPLAVHMARLVSMAFGVLTVVATYGIGVGVFGRTRPGLAAAPAAVVAFTPQFVFISGAINNDSAIAALSALVLWLVIAYGNKPRSYRWLIALGVAGGLASLSKAAGLASIGLIVAGLIAKAIRNKQLARIWQEILVVLAVSALVGGWWFARNWALYDDPLLSRYITRWFGTNAVSADVMLRLATLLARLALLLGGLWLAEHRLAGVGLSTAPPRVRSSRAWHSGLPRQASQGQGKGDEPLCPRPRGALDGSDAGRHRPVDLDCRRSSRPSALSRDQFLVCPDGSWVVEPSTDGLARSRHGFADCWLAGAGVGHAVGGHCAGVCSTEALEPAASA